MTTGSSMHSARLAILFLQRRIGADALAWAGGLIGASRYLIRSYDEERRRPAGPDVHRLLVFGAGDAGAQIVASMLRDPSSPYLPVALLDDDPTKRHLRIMGVPLMGDRTRMAEAADEHQADTLLVALPSAPANLIRELSDLAHEIGLDVKVLPGLGVFV